MGRKPAVGRAVRTRPAVRRAVRAAAAVAALGLVVLPAGTPYLAGPASAAASASAPGPAVASGTTAAPAPPLTTPTGSPVSPARPPACANAIQVVTGSVTSPPTPIPRPSSAVGGARLSAPGVQVEVPAGAPTPPVLPAAAWIVADLGTGRVLAACNAHVPFMPASSLKVLTALALERAVDPKATYVALPVDAAVDGTKVGLSPGSTYTGDDLFHGLLMASGNDAAHALADLAGGPAASTRLMAAQARRLGAFDTVPVNPSGLDAPGQVSSVYDLALLGRAALARPYLARLMKTRTYSFPAKGIGNGPARKRYQIQNHNRLLGSYPGTTGVKNGFTRQAGGSFIGSASRGGRSYLVAVLRADGRTVDMARLLLDWAFTTGATVSAVGLLVTPEDVAAGRLGDGDPVATATGPAPTLTPGAAGAPGTGTGATAAPTPSDTPAVTTAPTLGSPGPTSGTADPSRADAWVAGVVLGAVAAFALGSTVLVLRRSRAARSASGTVVPGLLTERLSRLPRRSGSQGSQGPSPGMAFPELADDPDVRVDRVDQVDRVDGEPPSVPDGAHHGADGAPRDA